MIKRNWLVHVPGYAPFAMLSLDGELDCDQALAEARAIWPKCSVS